MPDASACYPFATQPDFGVAAYVINDEEIGITCNLRVRVFVNPQKRTSELSRGMSATLPKADMLTYFIEVHSLEPIGRVRVIGNAGQDVGYG